MTFIHIENLLWQYVRVSDLHCCIGLFVSTALCKIHHKHIVVYVAFEVLDDGWLGLLRLAAGSDKDRVWSWIGMD